MNPSFKYSVQIITGTDQLTEALNLRYRVYKKVYPLLFDKENVEQKHESDEFDRRSVHLGLYCENDSEKKLAGYCRLILPEYIPDYFSNVLIEKHPLYLNASDFAGKGKMTFIKSLPEQNRHTINSFCKSLEQREIIYAETSRFIIDEEHRSMSLSTFFVSGMFAICGSLNIKYSFFTCTYHHVAFYSKYGLTLFPGIGLYENKIFGELVIFGTDLGVANKFQTSINDLRLQLETEKCITYKKAA